MWKRRHYLLVGETGKAMESLSECYVVHFVSETHTLYHGSETKVNARITDRITPTVSQGGIHFIK